MLFTSNLSLMGDFIQKQLKELVQLEYFTWGNNINKSETPWRQETASGEFRDKDTWWFWFRLKLTTLRFGLHPALYGFVWAHKYGPGDQCRSVFSMSTMAPQSHLFKQETSSAKCKYHYFFWLKESTIIRIGEKMLFSLFEERVPLK